MRETPRGIKRPCSVTCVVDAGGSVLLLMPLMLLLGNVPTKYGYRAPMSTVTHCCNDGDDDAPFASSEGARKANAGGDAMGAILAPLFRGSTDPLATNATALYRSFKAARSLSCQTAVATWCRTSSIMLRVVLCASSEKKSFVRVDAADFSMASTT